MLSTPGKLVMSMFDVRSQTSESSRERAMGVLRKLQGFREGGDIEWRVLGTGGQGQTLAARRSDGRPVWQDHDGVAVKLFDWDSPELASVICRQYESLQSLHEKLDGRVIEDWNIRVPRPLLKCDSTHALVMTIVPGESLYGYLQRADRQTTERLMSTSGPLTESLWRYWHSESRMHGDLHLENILCDLENQSLSFVDPGTPCEIWKWIDVSTNWYPLSRDLSFLLFDAASRSVKIGIKKPGVGRRLNRLVERIVRSIVNRIEMPSERLSLLDEIRACTELHLASLASQRYVRGIWCLFVRRTASRTIDGILNRIASEVDQAWTITDDAVANGGVFSQGGAT